MSDKHEHHDHHHHEHGHGPHGQAHHHHHHHKSPGQAGARLLVIRPNSGISGDILVAGLAALAGLDQAGLDQLLDDLRLPQLKGRVTLVDKEVNQVGGVALAVDLPPEHEHRNLGDIEEFLAAGDLSPRARELAVKCFSLLAQAEGAVHGRPPEEVHFHEVGALDSIMDIGLAAALLDRLNPERVVCGPLPVCDGTINCQHGLLPSPAPAVMRLLEGVPVIGLDSRGETVTPTGLALLLAFEAEFGPWPPVVPEKQALAYGTRLLPGVPNGAVFVIGRQHGQGGGL